MPRAEDEEGDSPGASPKGSPPPRRRSATSGERRTLRSRLDLRERELSALQAIAFVSNRGADARSVVDTALEVAHRAFASDATCFYRYDRERKVLVLEQHRGLDPGMQRDVQEVALGTGLNGAALQKGKALLSHEYQQDERAMPGVVFRGIESVIAAPIRSGDVLLGTMSVAAYRKAWDEADRDILASIAAQVGTAVENARLLERLRTSEARYRTLVETAPNVVYEARPDGNLLYASPKVQELTGHPAARFQSEPEFFSAIVHPDDRAARLAKLASLAKAGDRAVFEHRLLHANGVDIVWVADHVQARVARAGEPGPIVLAGVLVDLRERKMMEAAAREHSRLASLGELAAGVAHEVNNPLSGIMNYGQLAKRILERSPRAAGSEGLDDSLDGILAEADRIVEIMRTLVSFARRPEKEAYRALPPDELVRASLTIMKQRLKEDSIAIEVDVPPETPPVRARGHELTQVIQNLITNARHALNERYPRWDRGKVLSFRARRLPPDDKAPGGWVRFEVADRGCGIAAPNLTKVFVPFFTTKPEGTGLGLSISKDIVESHGGKMEIESRLGEGTTVAFTVPVF